jgi:hypothetical protein
LAKNQKAVDEELFHDIIPLIETHYKISDEPRKRAIAGLSMGGLQSIETGIVHLGLSKQISNMSILSCPVERTACSSGDRRSMISWKMFSNPESKPEVDQHTFDPVSWSNPELQLSKTIHPP